MWRQPSGGEIISRAESCGQGMIGFRMRDLLGSITTLRADGRMPALCALGLAVLGLLGCSWQAPRPPSILVIAVEQLGFNSFSCGDEGGEDETGGYAAFCAEAVRFTHAYAPSSMSQPSMVSILTGLYPYQHGVRHNGSHFAPAPGASLVNLPNAATAALARGYRTAFFSGGPPIFRRSGANVGFETFDDAVSPSLRALYRSAAETIRLFLSWRDGEAARASTFAVIYLADLQFPDVPTTNNLGESRSLSWASQNLEVNESLGALVRELKVRGAWDDSYVFLAGLNSHQEERRPGEPRPMSLYSDNVRVRLMAKPARKSGRESPFNWKVDANVSLVDLGRTLLDLLGGKVTCDNPETRPGPSACDGPAPVASLRSVLEGPEPAWPLDRMVLTESAWAQWQGWGPIRYAIRRGPHLFLSDGSGRLLNSYMDPLETSSLRDGDGAAAEFRSEAAAQVALLRAEPWRRLDPLAVLLVEIGARLWGPKISAGSAISRLRALTSTAPVDPTLAAWRARVALRDEDWNDLRAIGERASQPSWSYVAALNMGLKANPPNDPCLIAVRSAKSSTESASAARRECRSGEILEFLAWTEESGSAAQRQRAQDTFVRSYAYAVLDRAVAERNFALDLSWDSNRSLPGGPRPVEMVLALPENRKYRSALNRRLAELAANVAPASDY